MRPIPTGSRLDLLAGGFVPSFASNLGQTWSSALADP
jgi:hypothetical protein